MYEIHTFMKLSSKCLTSRVQPFIFSIIHQDQSGFIKGRSIADNFTYAADIVQTCFKRKKAAIVLKLDFKKAFDSVSWTALAAIMLAKGFPEIWCNWVDSLNRSSQSAVVLNGKPGPWINCRQGLRQGDSLSPYLFIIVADVLQRLIYQSSNDGRLAHPINQELPCPVLQYADDTLNILPAEAAQLQTLKAILLQFSQATGLHINFHKSTFAPIHVPPELANDLANIFGCPVASFPQSYLGLPLSTHKLRIADFFFIIDKIDRRLAGWHGILLSIAGRAILVRAVLRALPIYAMTSLLLPMGVVAEIDKRCRAFFWAGQDKVSGGQCKVAWDFVCAPFTRGGLGFSSLQHLSSCLRLSHLTKLHSRSTARGVFPLAARYGWSDDQDLGTTHAYDSHVWRDIAKGIPLFRNLTQVDVGNGTSTAFWLDLWVPCSTDILASQYPALFSHVLRPSTSVARVLSSPALCLDLAPRLTNAAELELGYLRNLPASVSLNLQEPDC